MTFLASQIKMFPFLSGSKTYLIGLAMIIYGWHKGDPEIIMEGLGFIFLRMGISKIPR